MVFSDHNSLSPEDSSNVTSCFVVLHDGKCLLQPFPSLIRTHLPD